LAQIIGEDDLSDIDRLYLEFGQELESKFIAQGKNENRSITETLDLGWHILSILPAAELDRMKTELIEKYYDYNRER